MGKFYINQTEEITGIRTTTFQVNASNYEEALQKLKREDIMNKGYSSIIIKKVNPLSKKFTKTNGF